MYDVQCSVVLRKYVSIFGRRPQPTPRRGVPPVVDWFIINIASNGVIVGVPECFVLSVKKCFDIEIFAGTNSINLRWLQRRRRRWGKVKDRKMSGSSHGAMRRHFGEMSVGNAIQHWNTVVKYSLKIQLNNTQQRGEMCVGNAIQPRFNPEIWPCCKRGRLQMRERLVSCFSNKAKVCALCPLRGWAGRGGWLLVEGTLRKRMRTVDRSEGWPLINRVFRLRAHTACYDPIPDTKHSSPSVHTPRPGERGDRLIGVK